MRISDWSSDVCSSDLPAQVRVSPPAAPVVARSQRVERGAMMPPYWMAPQFHVRDWDVYGFAPPAPDQRWIRYYDEALLLDRYGRVIDVRSDFDWDPYRDATRYAGPGVPVCVGARWEERRVGEEGVRTGR